MNDLSKVQAFYEIIVTSAFLLMLAAMLFYTYEKFNERNKNKIRKKNNKP
jgi:hypothetical protein